MKKLLYFTLLYCAYHCYAQELTPLNYFGQNRISATDFKQPVPKLSIHEELDLMFPEKKSAEIIPANYFSNSSYYHNEVANNNGINAQTQSLLFSNETSSDVPDYDNNYQENNFLNNVVHALNTNNGCYTCGFCNEILLTHGNLIKHLTIHNSYGRPYKCPEPKCMSYFTKPKYVAKHIKNKHIN